MFQVKSQIGHGDLPLKGLGTVKSWSGELDKSQNFDVMMDLTLWTIVLKRMQEVEGVNYLLW